MMAMNQEVVVAQVVERWHSVWAGCVQIPGRTGFFQVRIIVNLFSLDVGLLLITCNRTVHTLPSSFLFLIIICHCEKLSKGPYLKNDGNESNPPTEMLIALLFKDPSHYFSLLMC